MKFKLHIEYDGSNFLGWQKQKNAKTVQGTIIDAINIVFEKNGEKNKFIDFQGSGRTDSGVHAYEQVAHLECETNLSAVQLRHKLNAELSHSINIFKLEKASDKFHARHSAKSRQYVYKISKKRNPFERKYSWIIKDSLDIEKMRKNSEFLLGTHDFISFADKPSKEKSTIVFVESVNITETDNNIFVRITASHFIRKMVRRIVGVLVEIGKGNLNDDFIPNSIESQNPDVSLYTAPSMGLFLEKVVY